MKRILTVSVGLLCVAITANAQFKIHSNGNLSFHRPGAYGEHYSPISLQNGGNALDSTYFMSYNGRYNGLYFYAENAYPFGGRNYSGFFRCHGSTANINIGARGTAFSSSSDPSTGNPAAIGVWGDSNSYSQGRFCYGVLGTAYGTYNNAAVCGIATNTSLNSVAPDDMYAGLFFGKTKVAGNLTVTGTVSGVLTSPSGQGAADVFQTRGETLTEKIQGLSAFSFRLPRTDAGDGPEPTFLIQDKVTAEEMEKQGIDHSKAGEVEADVLADQVQAKRHYALSADELEKVFPDLVYEDKDGSKAINYVEMVPLLVQCINELNARLTALDGHAAAARTAHAYDTDDTATAAANAARVSHTQAVLHQNTPNPFTAQTVIRFSLPDDAPQAYIYIFDMTGKMQKQIPVDPSQRSVTINGYELSAGIYLYSLVVGGQEIDTKRMILSK